MYKHMASCAFFPLVFGAQWRWDQDLYRKLDCAGVLGLSTVAEPCSSHTALFLLVHPQDWLTESEATNERQRGSDRWWSMDSDV